MADSTSFRPHPFLRGGHLQTLAGFYWPTALPTYRASHRLLDVPGNDKIALHEDCPTDWSSEDQVVLMVHGLAGCHRSGYMVRLVERLTRRGIRCFRMDMRGTGAATGHATQPGHAGRTEDVAVAIRDISERCPQAALTLVGFSMGGNIALGTTADSSRASVGNLQRCIAVSPPVDLSKCCRELRMGLGKFYDRYLLRFLLKLWKQNGGELPNRRPNSIYEFDDLITAPLSGYRDAEDYYAQCSSGPRLGEINIPTIILAAKDDPVVSYSAIADTSRSSSVELVPTNSGGHLGYLSGRRSVDNGRWMDWQLTEWICEP